MIIDSSRQAPIREAIAMVFDGKHPCSLCLSIREGRQQEQAENKNLPSVRPENAPEYLCDVQRLTAPLPLVAASKAAPFVPRLHTDFLEPPPSPPPRSA